MATSLAMTTGQMRDRVRFERRQEDANGDRLGPWAALYSCAARIQYLHGGESVQAQRLEGSQPIVATVRACGQVRDLNPADRLVDARSGQIYGVKALELSDDRAWVDVLAISEAGGSVG